MPDKIDDPRELFLFELGSTLRMEKTVLGMLEKNAREATKDELKEQFRHHHDETEKQVRNLEQAFEALGKKPTGHPNPAIDGIKQEGKELLGKASKELRDSVILAGAAATEHHEISVYEGLITKAEAMGEVDIVALLQENLEQEQHTLQEVQRAAQQLAQRTTQQVGL